MARRVTEPRTRVTVRSALVGEYHRVRRHPVPVLGVVAANAVIMVAAWVWLPPFAKAWVFEAHGPLAFPIVLELWMLADVPATNILGGNARLSAALLDDPGALTRWLVGRSLLLTLIVGPPCAVIAVVIGVGGHAWVSVAAACTVLVVAPLGMLFAAAWLGVCFPYHPRPLRWRWANRHRMWVQLRWVALLLLPYAWVPAIASSLFLPGLLLSRRLYGVRPSQLTTPEFVASASLVVLTTVVAAVIGLLGVRALVAWRREPLRAYLADPDRG